MQLRVRLDAHFSNLQKKYLPVMRDLSATSLSVNGPSPLLPAPPVVPKPVVPSDIQKFALILPPNPFCRRLFRRSKRVENLPNSANFRSQGTATRSLGASP